MELTVEAERGSAARFPAPHPKTTLKSAVPCVKATSHSSTARPQEKDSLMVRRRACAVSNHETSHPSRPRFAAPQNGGEQGVKPNARAGVFSSPRAARD